MEKCPVCGKEFASQDALNQHTSAKHGGAKSGRSRRKIGIVSAVIIILIVIAAFLLWPKTGYTIQQGRANFRGPANANVTITEFSDFECPFCGQAEATVEQVWQKYNGTIRIVYEHFPLTQIHPYAEKAAEAAECAADQGKFWQMHDIMFANQERLTVNDLKGYAAQIGLNASFNACLDSGVMSQRVRSDVSDGTARGVTGTPTFFVGNVTLEGSGNSVQDFSRIIDQQMG